MPFIYVLELILAPVDIQTKTVLVMVFALMAFVHVMPCIKEKPVINLFVLIIAHILKVDVIERSTDVSVIPILKVSVTS